ELGDVDHPRRLALERLQLLLRELDVLVLAELVALDQRAPLHHLVAGGADLLLADAAAALLVELVERDATGRRGREHLDRDRDQAERDVGRPDGMSRHQSLLGLRWWSSRLAP